MRWVSDAHGMCAWRSFAGPCELRTSIPSSNFVKGCVAFVVKRQMREEKTNDTFLDQYIIVHLVKFIHIHNRS